MLYIPETFEENSVSTHAIPGGLPARAFNNSKRQGNKLEKKVTRIEYKYRHNQPKVSKCWRCCQNLEKLFVVPNWNTSIPAVKRFLGKAQPFLSHLF